MFIVRISFKLIFKIINITKIKYSKQPLEYNTKWQTRFLLLENSIRVQI